MTIEEIKALRLKNQFLTEPADASKVLRALCGIQAQYLSNAVHALSIRSKQPSLPEDCIKSWTLRGTMHLLSKNDLALFLHRGRTHLLRPKDRFIDDETATCPQKQHFAAVILSAIDRGQNSREALKAACRDAGMDETLASSLFDPWGGLIRAMCEEGMICHLPASRKAYSRCPAFEPMEKEAAQLEMARRYFTHYAPATLKDAAYFFSVPQAQVKKWLEKLPVSVYECAGRSYFSIPSPGDANEIPRCIFPAGFDPLLLGYDKTINPFLPEAYIRNIFNRNGIVFPSVLVNGRIAGKWQRQAGGITVTLFEPLPDSDLAAISACAQACFAQQATISFK